jgi:hypothetical protein
MIDASHDYDETWISCRRPGFRTLIIESLSISFEYHYRSPSKVGFISCISFLTWISSVRLLCFDEGYQHQGLIPFAIVFLLGLQYLCLEYRMDLRRNGCTKALIGSDAYLFEVEFKFKICLIVSLEYE